MKAFTFTNYGSLDELQLNEVEKPIQKENEVLIKVHAVSLNASDVEFLTARPVYIRAFGPIKPKYKILGSDIAGRIEAVGKNVKQFNPGDEVFCDTLAHGLGGLAEYVCVPADILVLKPDSISFQSVAAIPQAGVVALQGLRDKGKVQSGQHILINGAGGGSGTFAIQIAKMYGAKVTAVDTVEKQKLMKSLGADHAIDYKNEDFAINGPYDLILDFVAYRSLFDHKRALSSSGNYVLVGGSMLRILQTVFLGPIISKLGKKNMGMLLHKQNINDIQVMTDLIKNRIIKIVIDKNFAFNEAAEALRYQAGGLAKGKVIISF